LYLWQNHCASFVLHNAFGKLNQHTGRAIG